jgi:hypothetical protein
MRVLLVALATLSVGCGVRTLPPPDAPTRQVPPDLDVPDDPPKIGTSRVILDADGERARVLEIGEDPAAARPLCTTPCVLDLPYGTHPLVLQSVTDAERRSRAQLEVGPHAKVFRHALGERRDGGATRTLGTSLLAIGLLAATTGAVFWGGGALARSMDGTPNGLEGTGQLVTGLGAGAVLLSIPLLVAGRPVERPGATTEWTF